MVQGRDTNFRNVFSCFHSPLPQRKYPLWASYLPNAISTVKSVLSDFALEDHPQEHTLESARRLETEIDI